MQRSCEPISLGSLFAPPEDLLTSIIADFSLPRYRPNCSLSLSLSSLSQFTLLSSFFLFLPLVSVARGNNRLRATLFWPRVQPLRTTRTESYQFANRKPPFPNRSSSAALRLQSLLAGDRRAMPAIVKTIILSVYARSREKEVVTRATLPPLYGAFTAGIIRVGFPKLRTSSKPMDGPFERDRVLVKPWSVTDGSFSRVYPLEDNLLVRVCFCSWQKRIVLLPSPALITLIRFGDIALAHRICFFFSGFERLKWSRA